MNERDGEKNVIVWCDINWYQRHYELKVFILFNKKLLESSRYLMQIQWIYLNGAKRKKQQRMIGP